MIDNPGRRDLLLAGSLAVLAGGTLAPLRAEAQPATGPAPAKELRILLLNPNSSPDFTRIIAAEARRVGSPGTEFVEVTSPFGPRYIGSRATVAIASHAAIDGLVGVLAKDKRFDAAILAGFGAQGVPAMREIAPFPVVDMLTASTSAAILLGNRFSVLTGGDRWVPMLKEQLTALGLGDRVASVRAIPLTGAEITKDPERALALLADLSETCVREDGAECVILGGAAVTVLLKQP